MAWLLASLRQLRVERIAALGFALLVLATAFVFALAPRVLDAEADTALRDEVAAAAPVERNIQLLAERRVNPDPREAMLGVQILGDRFEQQFPASIRDLIVDRAYLAQTSRWHIESDEATQHFAPLRFQPGVEDRVDVVEGRWPTGATSTLPYWDPDVEPFDVTVFEAALAVPSAEEIGAHVGDVIRMEVDPSDRLNRGVPNIPTPADRIALRIVGLYRVDDPDSPYWLGDRGLAAPVLRAVSSEVQFWDVTPVLSPDAYEPYMRATEMQQVPLAYTWRYYVDPARLDAERADTVVSDLRRMESIFTSGQGGGGGEVVSLRSGLLRITEAQRAGWHSVEAVLAVIAVGPAAVAITALALVVALLERRRRGALALQRGRGASTLQLVAASLFEGLLLVVPAVAIAAAAATRLVPTAPTTPTVVAAIGVALVALLLLVGLTVPAARLGPDGGRATTPGRRSGARRLVLEGTVVVLAVLGAVLLRSRGVQGASSSGGLATPDPLIAGVPALLGLAAALVAMRLYPLAMRAIAAVAGLRRDLVPALALRQAARGSTGGPTLLVLLTTVALGAFSSAALVHLDRAADAVSWQETGAAFALRSSSGGPLPSGLDASALPSVQASARSSLMSATYAKRGIRVPLLAVETGAYQQVAAGTPADPAWPLAMLGDSGLPLPVIVSGDLAAGPDALSVGDELELIVDGRQVPLQVVEVRSTFPSLAAGQSFVIVSFDQLASAVHGLAMPITTTFLRAPDDAAGPIRESLAGEASTVRLDGRSEMAAAQRSSPIVGAVTAGVAVAALVALAYAGLAVASSLALSGAARASEVAMLRTLGLTDRQSLGLIVVEHGPTVVVAFVAGTVLGLGLFAVLRPGLGLGTVVGSPLDIPLAVDPVQLLVLLGAIVVIVAVSIVVAGSIQRSVAPVDALRRGIG